MIFYNCKTNLWKVSPTGFNLAWEFRWILGQQGNKAYSSSRVNESWPCEVLVYVCLDLLGRT